MDTILLILLNLVTGSASLVFGVNLMSASLEKMSMHKIRKILARFTSNVVVSLIAGTVITILTQSSTAVTLITVSMINSGMLSLAQAVGVIYGANIGTTITAQFMSLNLPDFALLIILAGIITRFFGNFTKRRSVKYGGNAIIGLGVMLMGINILGWSIPYMEKSGFIKHLFAKFGKNPYLGLITGTIATALIHSSSATVGLTIVLFNGGLINFNAALGLILGDNIGTCFTTQISTIGASIPARRAAWAHTLYNIIGSLIALVFLNQFSHCVKIFTIMLGQDKSRLIANAHTVFNLLSAVIFLPFTRYYVKFIEWLVPYRHLVTRGRG
ncbi:MAG: Na/Pi cotransporter family protein [Clostridiaceae bacterium]|nr:Na/Pi cotransporter family protein [Clostridiaceae bacterium]